ncbi:oligopeptide ABC transporter ATP-binding protein [Spiroplasma syrphidicola EA-1]|uniref:Oligopeptide ABC transporter ATP-binding protein n=1 Tax=Spiroplasma syrphidicola EA-1 TaxID=1276229 RepID=R4UL70_9MOLU|nr:ATP-binding cassette domain-containing protein [Spiroplasma syrphidicola]AGM26006.1 oligopeptide ABC transporter ATP-binding protein [Spiroplasma syrphidicola EA-1]
MQKHEDIMLRVRDVVVQFRQKQKRVNAVKGASFDIYRGEIFSIVGESGSGKTTIGRAIAGIEQIKEGAVYMNNKIIRGKAPNLLKNTLFIQERIRLITTNNTILSKNLESYINELKIRYYQYFENARYNPTTKQLTPYLNKDYQNIIATKGAYQTIFARDKAGKHFRILQEQIENNIYLLTIILKKYQALIRFVDKLNEYIPDLDLALETALTTLLKANSKLCQELILSAQQLYTLLEIIVKLHNDLSSSASATEIKNYFEEVFEIIRSVLEQRQEYLVKHQTLKQNNKQLYLLLAPQSERQKIIKNYHKRYFVRTKDLNALFAQQAKEGLKTTGQQTEFSQLKQKSDVLANLTIALNLLNELLIVLNSNGDVEKAFDNLTANEGGKNLAEYLAPFKNDLPLLTSAVKELIYFKKYNVYCDLTIINLYNKLVNKPQLSGEQFNEIKEFLALLELPIFDEVITKHPLFKTPSQAENRQNKKKIQMVFQDPSASLNDRISVEEIIGEGLEAFPEIYKNDEARNLYLEFYNANLAENEAAMTLKEVKDLDVKRFLILNMIKEVGLLPEHLSRYSHEFSGGQRQRIGIARALIMKPEFIIADEPISALDVSIRAQILNLLKKFQSQINLTYIFVAHDLSVVRFIADRIAVIYHGQLVELAPAEELFINPLHPYTKALLSAIPLPNPNLEKNREHYIYDPEIEHYDYHYALPEFHEVIPNHFVFGNKREIITIKQQLKEQDKTNSKGGVNNV